MSSLRLTDSTLHANVFQLPASVLTTDYDTGVLLLTLQGLVNRNPHTATPLILNTLQVFNQFYGADAHWIEYLESTKNVTIRNLTFSGINGLLDAYFAPPPPESFSSNSTARTRTGSSTLSRRKTSRSATSLLAASTASSMHIGRVAINGVVLYDGDAPNEPDATRYVALNLCGLESLLPVTPALRLAYPRLAALPVRHDLRGNFSTNDEAYSFALTHLMPRVNRSVGWSAGRTHVDDAGWEVWQGSPPEMPLLGLDVAIARSGFIFNLSPNATGCDGTPKTAQCRGSPHEAALFDAVMAGLNATTTAAAANSKHLPAIYGWTEPESEYTLRVSAGGAYVLCSGAPNLSFWAFFAIAPDALHHAFGRVARRATSPPLSLKAKTYVTFETNEGDTPKIVAGLFGGSWLNKNRGAVPIAWGINLLLCREFPSLMEYFANTATVNDTFFAGTSGAGYVYPSILPPTAFIKYVEQVQAVTTAYSAPPHKGASADWLVDLWNWGVPEGTSGGKWAAMIAKYAELAPAVGAWSQQTIGGDARTVCVPLPSSSVPVSFASKLLWYPGSPNAPWSRAGQTRAGALDDLEARIRATDRANTTTFTIVYGLVDGNRGPDGLDAIDAALAMVARLPRERFEIIGAQDLARLSAEHCVA